MKQARTKSPQKSSAAFSIDSILESNATNLELVNRNRSKRRSYDSQKAKNTSSHLLCREKEDSDAGSDEDADQSEGESLQCFLSKIQFVFFFVDSC